MNVIDENFFTFILEMKCVFTVDLSEVDSLRMSVVLFLEKDLKCRSRFESWLRSIFPHFVLTFDDSLPFWERRRDCLLIRFALHQDN